MRRPLTVDSHRLAMADGIRLATDVHRPASPGRRPVVLIRTPYGRNGLTGIPMVTQARLLVAAGYVVVLQDVRGRFDSEGDFVPMVNEGVDGARTLEWIHDQPWCDGHVGCWGLSYLAAAAWAAAATAPDMVGALAVGIGHSRLGLPDPRGVRHLETTLRWLRSLEVMHDRDGSVARRVKGLVDARRRDAGLAERMRHLPLAELDGRLLASPSPIWHAWAAHPSPADPFWRAGDHRPAVATVPPTAHTTGWWDVFVDQQLEDHAIQVTAGRPGPLLVGPWTHLDPRVQLASLRQARVHMDAHLRRRTAQPQGARVWVSGAERWWHLPAWPPPTRSRELLLSRAGLSDGDVATSGDAMQIRYDPQDPTPSIGGRSLSVDAGRVDCRVLERRDDVVVVSGRPLDRPLTVAGTVTLHATVSSDAGAADLAVRLTDVDPSGRSVSVTDGYARVADARDGAAVDVVLHPVAHRFEVGHRIRLLLAGGAFPHFDRNLGGTPEGWLHQTRPRPSTVVLERGASMFLPALR